MRDALRWGSVGLVRVTILIGTGTAPLNPHVCSCCYVGTSYLWFNHSVLHMNGYHPHLDVERRASIGTHS